MSDAEKKPNTQTLEQIVAERPALLNKVILLNGFDYQEISAIMKAVKALFPNPKDLIFAKSTATNLDMSFGDIIEDISEDHAYLLKNPPMRKKAELSEVEPQTGDASGDGASDASDSASGDKP